MVVDERLYRPAEVYDLRGDASKARRVLGWQPQVTFDKLASMMVRADLERVARQMVAAQQVRPSDRSPA